MRKRLNKSGAQKDGLLKKAIEIFKRANENEKRKKEIRKREKKSRPKGYRAKKLGAFTFWLLFSFMLVIVFVNVFSSNGLSSTVTEGDEAELNKASSAEGIEFAKSFLVTYFNWNIDNEKRSDRISRLGRYLPDALNEEAVTGGSKWNSTLTRESIVLKDIDNLGDSKALITFQVKVLFQRSAVNNQAEDKAKSSPERVKADKYISVPIFYDGEENRFIVYDLPSFTFVEQEKIDSTIALETDGLKSVTDGSTQNIKAFLDTFFEAFSSDSKDKLTYLVEDPEHQNGLNQTMNFVRLKNTEIFEGKKAEEKVVRTEVILAEPDTGIEFTSSYLLVLAEKEGRYTVLHINNKSYIDELKNKKHEEEIEATEGRELHKEDDPEDE